MKRRIYIVTVIASIVVAIVLLVAFAKPLGRIYGSIKIVEAIKRGDIAEIRKISKKEPSAVNSPATYISKGLYRHQAEYIFSFQTCLSQNTPTIRKIPGTRHQVFYK